MRSCRLRWVLMAPTRKKPDRQACRAHNKKGHPCGSPPVWPKTLRLCRYHRTRWAILSGVILSALPLLNVAADAIQVGQFVTEKTTPPTRFPEDALTPNNFEELERRFEEAGKYETFEIRDEADIHRVLGHLDQFIERPNKVMLTPAVFGVVLEFGTPRRRMVLEMQSAPDVIAQIRALAATRGYPATLTLYPEAVITVTAGRQVTLHLVDGGLSPR